MKLNVAFHIKNHGVHITNIDAKQQAKLTEWRGWGSRMATLREIHREVAPELAVKRAARDAMDYGRYSPEEREAIKLAENIK